MIWIWRHTLLYAATAERADHREQIRYECRLEQHDVPCKRVRLVGGGSQSALWRRIVADVLQLPVVFPEEADSAALGAALQAAAVHQGADVREFVLENEPSTEPAGLEPDETLAAVYGAALTQHRAAGTALFGTTGPDA